MKKIIDIKPECRQIIAVNQPEFKGGKNDIFKPEQLPDLPRWRSADEKPEDGDKIAIIDNRRKYIGEFCLSTDEEDDDWIDIFLGDLCSVSWFQVKGWLPLSELLEVVQ